MNLASEHRERQEKQGASINLPESYVNHFFSTTDAFIEYALDSTLSLVAAHAGSLFLWDESRKALVFKSARGPYKKRMHDVHVRLREGISGWVGDRGESLLVKDIRADERFSTVNRPGAYESRSFISLPLISGNKLLGVINITEKSDYLAFSEEDLIRARLFVQHVAIAFDNMRKVQRLKHENDLLNDKVSVQAEQLKSQEPLVEVGRLASNLAHELNNPLDSIRRYVNLALDQVMEDSLGRQYILKAKDGVRRAIQVVRGLLQYSRDTAKVESRQADIHTILRRSLTCVSKDNSFENITVRQNFSDSRWIVKDCGLYVVFRNLFKNAHHAMNGTGTLTVTTCTKNQQVIISVRDTGCGMPAVVRDRLFEPFFTTKGGDGTGIGLTICHGVIEKCGGTIECHSNEGEGTEFVIRLPYFERG